jgi:hypothetical protein
MSRNTSVTLGEHFAGFVEAQVESGPTVPRATSCAQVFGFWKSRK